MFQQKDRLFVFSGQMFAGKDFVAKWAGLQVHGFSDPIYELCEYFNNTRDKSAPGVRRWMQLIGQWGWGCVTEEYAFSPERSAFVEAVRHGGAHMTKNFGWVDWSEFGLRQDFWVHILLGKLKLTGSAKTDAQLRLAWDTREPFNIAVTNSRFEHELQPLRNAGFEHFHVRCSEATRRERMAKAGYKTNDKESFDIGEQMALRFNDKMPDHRVVWNDAEPMPEDRNYLTPDQFVEQSHAKLEYERPCEVVRESALVPVS